MAIDLTTLGIATDTTGMKPGIEDVKKLKDEAAKAAKAATELEKSMVAATAKAVAFGAGIAGVVVGVGYAVAQFVKLGLSISKYQDLADQTQSDPAGLAALQVTADVAGVSIDNIAMAMGRLNVRLAKANPETGQLTAVIKGLGLSFAELQKMTPEEKYRAIAVALNGFADGATKAAYAQILFGLNGTMQLRVMKELAQQTGSNNILTNEQIKLADDTVDALVRTKSEVRQFAQAFAANVNPAVNAATKALTSLIGELMGTGSEATRLAKNKGMRDWAFDAVDSLATVLETMSMVGQGLMGIGAAVGWIAGKAAVQTQRNAILHEQNEQQGPITKEQRELTKQRLADLDEFSKGVTEDFNKRLAEIMKGGERAKRLREENKKARDAAQLSDMYEGLEGRRSEGGVVDPRRGLAPVTPEGDKKGKVARETVSAYDLLMRSMDRKYEKELRSAAMGRELTTVEKMTLEVEEQMTAARQRAAARKEKDPYTDQEVQAAYYKIQAMAEAADANDFRQASTKAEEREAASAMKSAEAYTEKAQAYEKSLNVMGLTRDGIEQMEATTLRAVAAFILEKVAIQEMMGPLTEAGEVRAKAMRAQAASMLGAASAAEKLSVAQSQSVDSAEVSKRLANLQRESDRLAYHAAIYGKSADEVEKYNIKQMRLSATQISLTAVGEAAENQSSDFAKQLWKEADATRQLAKDREDLLNKDIKDRRDPMVGAKKGLEAYVTEAKNVGKATEDVAYKVANGIEDNLIQGIMTGKAAWGDLIEYMLQEALRLMVIKPMLAEIFGGSSGSGGLIGFLAGFMGGGGGASTGAASTGAELSLAAGMPIGTFAGGGSPPVNKMSIVGERGPELFVPKTAGEIIPNNQISGGGGSVTVIHNNTFGTGVSPSQLAQALEQNRAQTIAEVSDQMRRGSRRFS